MTRSRVVLGIWAVAIAVAVAGVFLMATDWREGAAFTPHSIVSLGFATVGALIMTRRPHRIGALFLTFGVFAAFTGLLFQLCGADHQGSQEPAGFCSADAGRLGPTLWPASYLFFGSLFLLFPTGHLPSPRWRPIAWVFTASWGGIAIGNLIAGDWVDEHVGFLIPLAVAAMAVVATAPLFRIRRADAIERQQLRWLGYVIALSLLLVALGIPLDLAGRQEVLDVVNVLLFANVAIGIPAAITIAILRYRLYEIDLIVNRTLVYALLTAALAAAYLGSVFVLQTLLGPVTADSDIAVAGSTLAVAALFRPLRSRVQSFIDHRFYRRKYDAVETLQGFSSHLRDQVDLTALSRELVAVVGTTMQPAHASLWLRRQEGAR